jgi:hypothetical protein
MSSPDTLGPQPSFNLCERALEVISVAICDLTTQMRLLNLHLAEPDKDPDLEVSAPG